MWRCFRFNGRLDVCFGVEGMDDISVSKLLVLVVRIMVVRQERSCIVNCICLCSG